MRGIPGGITVKLWGQKRIVDTTLREGKTLNQLGKSVWTVDKGSFKGVVFSQNADVQDSGMWVRRTTLWLMCPYDTAISLGDIVEINGAKYYLEGEPESWKIHGRVGVMHLEIQLRAKEG